MGAFGRALPVCSSFLFLLFMGWAGFVGMMRWWVRADSLGDILRDFDLIVHPLYGGHDITIVPIADVHLGAEGCMQEEFIDFVKTIAETPNLYVILGGDLIENATKSSVSNVYRQTMSPMEQKKMMTKILEPIASKVLAVVGGNHERRSSRECDQDVTYDIAAKLNIEDRFRESIAFVKIQLGIKEYENGGRTDANQRPTYVLTVTHGSGGGVLTGGVINRNERFGYILDGSDCLIAAHSHKPVVTNPAKIKIDSRNNLVTVQDFKVVVATSWLRYTGYPIQKMLLPSAHCIQYLTLSGSKKKMSVTM